MLSLKHITKDGGRPPIPEAIATTVERYINGYSSIGHVLPPRVGKSSIIRGAALELGSIGAPFVLCLCPWKNLATQLTRTDKTKDFIKHYGVVLDKPFSSQAITKISHSDFYVREGGVPTLLSCTIGLALHAASGGDAADSPLIEAIRIAKAETKMSPVIIVDEVQVVGNSQSWGVLVHRLMDAGAFIVTMTGTEVRADCDLMPGFEKIDAGGTPDSMSITTVLGQEERDGVLVNRLRRDTYTSTSGIITPIGGVNIGWEMAFRHAWMLRTSVIQIDTEEVINGSERVMLSDIPKASLRGMLSGVLRDEKMIAKGAEVLLRRLQFWRAVTGRKAQALVITGADSKDESVDDWHARECRRVIRQEFAALGINGAMPDLRIEIATSNTEGSESANDKITAFINGDVDILIVKMMGLVGLDVPACMVTLNLSTVRRGPLAKQANSRHLTPWVGVTDRPADLIIPRDKLAQEMVAELGAQGGVVKTWTQAEIGEEYEKPVEARHVDVRVTEAARVSGYADEVGGSASGDNEATLYAIKTKYITGTLTDPEIMANYDKGGYHVTDAEKAEYQAAMDASVDVIDLTELADEKRGQFGKRAKTYANSIVSYSSNPDGYRNAIAVLQSNAKKIARFRGNVADVDDPGLMQRLMDALDQAYADMKGGV